MAAPPAFLFIAYYRNRKNMTGVLILPAGRRCRDGSGAVTGRPGL